MLSKAKDTVLLFLELKIETAVSIQSIELHLLKFLQLKFHSKSHGSPKESILFSYGCSLATYPSAAPLHAFGTTL